MKIAHLLMTGVASLPLNMNSGNRIENTHPLKKRALRLEINRKII